MSNWFTTQEGLDAADKEAGEAMKRILEETMDAFYRRYLTRIEFQEIKKQAE